MIRIIKKIWLRARPRVIGTIRHARLLGVTIGDDCRIYISEWGSEPFLISIGDKVTITNGVRFLTHDGSTWLFSSADGSRYQRYDPITVGSRVFIGSGAIILPGVTIGNDCVIGAGAVVTRDVPPGTISVGNPARICGQTADLAARIAQTCVTDKELGGITDYRARVEAAINIASKRREL